MKKKLTNNDPRLTAYSLGELPRDEADEVSRMLDANENRPLKREVEEIDSLSIMLTQTLSAGAGSADRLKLSPGQRDAIFRSAKAPTADDVSSTHQSSWIRPVLVTLGAAALVTVSFMVLDNVDSNEDEMVLTTEESFPELAEDKLHAPIQPSGADWEGNSSSSRVSSGGTLSVSHALAESGVSRDAGASELIQLKEHDWVNRADEAVTRLPLACGKASWHWVKQSIEADGLVPDKNAVRLEEIVNAFHYDEPSDLELTLVTAGVELVQCPWNNESMVAVILVKNTHSESVEIEAALAFSESVEKYRLVGYAKAEMTNENIIAPAKIRMKAGGSHLVLYEIVNSATIENAADVLSLNVRTATVGSGESLDEDRTLNVQYSSRSWKKADQDIQLALVLASWVQCITGSDYDADMHEEDVEKMITHLESSFTFSGEQGEALEILKKGLTIK